MSRCKDHASDQNQKRPGRGKVIETLSHDALSFFKVFLLTNISVILDFTGYSQLNIVAQVGWNTNSHILLDFKPMQRAVLSKIKRRREQL